MTEYSRKAIQWIAALTMVLDHIGYIFVPPEQWPVCYEFLRLLGRLSFPLFCFMMAEGAQYTKDSARYIGRIAVFAVLSEIPFDLAFSDRLFDMTKQNVLFTLLLGLLALQSIRRAQEYFAQNRGFAALSGFGGVVVCAALAELLHTDYGCFGVLLVAAFYLGRRSFTKRLMLVLPVLFFMGVIEWAGAFSLYFVKYYNPENPDRMPKWFLYFFYPGHLLVLYGISKLLF